MEELEFYPILKFNGRTVTMYQIDLYGVPEEDLDPAHLYFTYAEFDDCQKTLTENQLLRLGRKYPEIIYLLIKDDLLPKDSLHHATYQHLITNPSGEYCVF